MSDNVEVRAANELTTTELSGLIAGAVYHGALKAITVYALIGAVVGLVLAVLLGGGET